MWNQDVPARVPEDVFSYSGSRFDGTTKLSLQLSHVVIYPKTA